MKILFSLLVLIPSLLFADPKEEEQRLRNLVSDGMTAYSEKEYAKAILLFKEALELQGKNKSSAVAYNIACCYAILGDKDNAMKWLEKAYDLGTYKFSDDEDLVSLKEDKRFQKLERKALKKIKALESKEWKPIITVPESFESKKYPVVIALHGFGSNPVDFSRTNSPRITPLGYILSCPYGPEIRGSTSFGWGEDVDSEKRILEALETLKKDYRIEPERIILFGYSQGGGRAFYTGLRNPEIFRGIITAAGEYEEEECNGFLETAKAKGVKVYMMIGEKDFLLESNQKAEEEMKKVGIPVKLVVFPGLGHAFPKNSEEELKKALEWVNQ